MPPSTPPVTRSSARTLLVALAAVLALLLPAAPTLAAAPGNPPGGTGQPGAKPEKPGKKKDQEEPDVWTGSVGTNTAHATYGYPWPAAPNCNEATVDPGSCVNDGLGFFQGQCTSWVAYRLNQRNGFAFSNWYAGRRWGNASEWGKVARDLGNKPDKVPAVGAVGWYRRGHVSYVEAVNYDGSIVISEMNTDGANGFHLVTVHPGGAGWPDRFIHFADVVPVDRTAPEVPGSPRATTVRHGVRVDWRKPADDMGVTGYTVRRDGVEVARTTTPTFTDRRATPGQPYTYTITARDAAGNVSGEATARLALGTRAPARLAHDYAPGTARKVTVSGRTLVCGLQSAPRARRVACTLRTATGPRTVRTEGRTARGSEASRAFLGGGDGRAWFCRDIEVRGTTRHACVPFDLATRSWDFDRVDNARAPLARQTWLMTPDGPAVCGSVRERATCSTVDDRVWRAPRRAASTAPGDPLTRAFLPTGNGLAYCRVVSGRAACSELEARGRWERDVRAAKKVAPGRWRTGETGPALCPPGEGRCRTVEVDPTPATPRRRDLARRLS